MDDRLAARGTGDGAMVGICDCGASILGRAARCLACRSRLITATEDKRRLAQKRRLLNARARLFYHMDLHYGPKRAAQITRGRRRVS